MYRAQIKKNKYHMLLACLQRVLACKWSICVSVYVSKCVCVCVCVCSSARVCACVLVSTRASPMHVHVGEL